MARIGLSALNASGVPGVFPRQAPCAAAACLLLLTAAGCRLDIVRARSGNPLDRPGFEALEVGKTTREDAVDRLGAPEKVEWKNGKDYLYYLYGDMVDAGIRFQFPPFRSLFAYQHTFLRMDENSDEVNAMELVFDEVGSLERKSLRLSRAYMKETEEEGASWKLHLTPHAEHSLLVMGDGGVEDYGKLFRNGFRAGLKAGFQPVPAFLAFIDGTYQEYQGRSFREATRDLSFDDLKIYQLEVGFKLSIPMEAIFNLHDFNRLKRALFDEDLERPRGVCLFAEGATGGFSSASVPVKVDGLGDGNFYDRGLGLTANVSAGLEYDWGWGLAYLAAMYQITDAFDRGNSTVDDRGAGLDALLVGCGLGIKF